jgi:serine protease Do
MRYTPLAIALGIVLSVSGLARSEESLANIAEKVDPKVVKLFGSGGFRGLASYGSGILVSSDGYILTINSHLLDTQDLRVHLSNGYRYHAKVVAIEPELDVALVKIGTEKEPVEGLDYFDVVEAAKRTVATPGTGVIAFSNQFQIATRGEPMSVQRGVVAAYARLYGRIGIFEATYKGDVYVIDAITNNPGGAGGAITTRKGELLGLVGRELRNELTNTWINYAVPIGAKLEVRQADDKMVTISILDVVEKKEKYKAVTKKDISSGNTTFHGILLVPEVVERTPPYVEDVLPGSPAEKAGIRSDDLIVYIDGLPVNDIHTFKEVLARYQPNMQMKVEVQRGNKLQTVMLTLEKPRPKTPKKPAATP